MKNYQKYQVGYFPPADGSQQLGEKGSHRESTGMVQRGSERRQSGRCIVPMSLDEKVDFFKYLVKIGFKEIEVGFPAASGDGIPVPEKAHR